LRDATLLLGHSSLHHLAAGTGHGRLERWQNRVVQRNLTTGQTDADEAFASNLVLENVQRAPGKIFPGLGTIALVSLLLGQRLLSLEHDIVGLEFFWSKLGQIDLL
jgi:hypothetical protein